MRLPDGYSNPYVPQKLTRNRFAAAEAKAEENARKDALIQRAAINAWEYIHKCPMCNSDIECQDDYCYRLREWLEDAETK